MEYSTMNAKHDDSFAQLEEATIVELQAAMTAGQLSAQQLIVLYLEHIAAIDQHGPTLNSVIEINPDCLDTARALDQERASSGARGPLHGIPILDQFTCRHQTNGWPHQSRGRYPHCAQPGYRRANGTHGG